jgi:hypothetical protein
MRMNDLLKEKLLSFLSEFSQEFTNEEMQNAYGCFMEQVRKVSQSEQNYSKVFRMLNITRIELVFIESLYRYGQGEKCPKINKHRFSCKIFDPNFKKLTRAQI